MYLPVNQNKYESIGGHNVILLLGEKLASYCFEGCCSCPEKFCTGPHYMNFPANVGSYNRFLLDKQHGQGNTSEGSTSGTLNRTLNTMMNILYWAQK